MRENLFHNELLESDIANDVYNFSELSYSIDKNPDPYRKFWTLYIYSTSISELEGSEEGILGDYSYFDKTQALQDVETFETIGKAYLSEV